MQSLVGALGLCAIVVVEGGEARAALGDILRRPAQALILGALAIAAPFMLIALGELSVPSGLTGVLASTTPVFVAPFAPWIDPSMKINRRQGVGLAVALVVGPTSPTRSTNSSARWPFLGRRPAARWRVSSSGFGTETRGYRRARPASSR